MLCRSQQPASLGGLFIDGGQGQFRGRLQEVIGVLEERCRPGNGGDDFGNTDAAVPVGVKQLQGSLIEFQSLGGTAQGEPELLVEFSQGSDIPA